MHNDGKITVEYKVADWNKAVSYTHLRIPFQNKSTQEHRYEGWATGIGISYGYTWILGKRWNLEANIGAGYIYTKYDKYECKTCGRFKGNQKKHYFGPTKAGISLIYIIK